MSHHSRSWRLISSHLRCSSNRKVEVRQWTTPSLFRMTSWSLRMKRRRPLLRLRTPPIKWLWTNRALSRTNSLTTTWITWIWPNHNKSTSLLAPKQKSRNNAAVKTPSLWQSRLTWKFKHHFTISFAWVTSWRSIYRSRPRVTNHNRNTPNTSFIPRVKYIVSMRCCRCWSRLIARSSCRLGGINGYTCTILKRTNRKK